MKAVCDALLVTMVVCSLAYVCRFDTKPATTVFAVGRLWYSKTEENSTFASDLSGRRVGLPD